MIRPKTTKTNSIKIGDTMTDNNLNTEDLTENEQEFVNTAYKMLILLKSGEVRDEVADFVSQQIFSALSEK